MTILSISLDIWAWSRSVMSLPVTCGIGFVVRNIARTDLPAVSESTRSGLYRSGITVAGFR